MFIKQNFLLKIYIILSGSAILFAGILHLMRLIYQTPVIIGTVPIPMFLSYFGLAGSIGIIILAVWLFRKYR